MRLAVHLGKILLTLLVSIKHDVQLCQYQLVAVEIQQTQSQIAQYNVFIFRVVISAPHFDVFGQQQLVVVAPILILSRLHLHDDVVYRLARVFLGYLPQHHQLGFEAVVIFLCHTLSSFAPNGSPSASVIVISVVIILT